jgi:hypothetical protein
MGDLVVIRNAARQAVGLPALVARAGEGARTRFLEFFTANIRNPICARPTPASKRPSAATPSARLELRTT